MNKIFYLFLIICLVACKDNNKEISTLDDKKVLVNGSQLSYNVYKYDVIKKASVTKYILEVALNNNDVTDSIELKKLLTYLYDKEVIGKELNSSIVDIKVYESVNHIKSGMGQWIGWLSKSRNEVVPTITIKLPNKNLSNVVVRIDEIERRKIWEELIHIEDRAVEEAKRKNLDLDKENALMNKYRINLQSKYSISKEELMNIKEEAFLKNWPFPKKK